MYGDENYAFYENDQGYTAVYDPKLGLFCYGKLEPGRDDQGNTVEALVSTGAPITNNPPKGLEPGQREAPEVRRAKVLKREADLRAPYVHENLESRILTYGPDRGLLPGRKIHKGKVVGLTILVEFQDVPFQGDKDEITRMLNQPGYTENGNFCSVRDYFLMMSGGRLDYRNEVFGLYLVHLGVILGGYFGQRQLGSKDTDTPVFLVAFVVSLIWNILASWFLFWMCWMDTSGGSIADAKDYLAKYPQFSSSLVSGALAYFFVLGTKGRSARSVTADSSAVRS